MSGLEDSTRPTNAGGKIGRSKNEEGDHLDAHKMIVLIALPVFPEKTGVSGVPARRPRPGFDNVGSRFVPFPKGGLP
jgi:hypothetical protein